jgi:ABC-2 type transport system ATP-binding protein
MPAISVSQLVKTYQTHRKEPGLRGSIAGLFRREAIETRAVDGVSFSIEPGEIVGFLGPNGAGKTTTLKLLSGLLYPTGGLVRVLEREPSRREPEYLRQIALVMGQKSMLWWDIPAMETLLLHREMYRIPETQFRRTVADLAEMLEVAPLLGMPVRKLSLGERMKIELLAALVHSPAVLFLDEPTIGLDVISQQRVRDFLRQVNQERGTTILLTSHYMDDIEALCRRVLVIDHGRLRFDGTLGSLVEQAAPHKTQSAIYTEPPTPAALASLAAPEAMRATDDPRRVRLEVPRAEAAELAGRLLSLGRVVDLSIEDVPVEQIIRGVFQAAEYQGAQR